MPDYKTSLQPAQLKASFEQRTLEGYASTFGNVDEVGDIVVGGAFKRTIADRIPRKLIKVCYNHGILIGSPLSAVEDSAGLATVAKIAAIPEGDKVLQLALEGHLTHNSIAYDVVRREYIQSDDSTKAAIRRLLEIKLYEFGPVDFPANELAGILAVKDIHEALREATAAQPQLAQMLAKKGFFKDSEVDLYKHLSGVIATAIAAAIKALSEAPPEPAAPADEATTAPGDPPNEPAVVVADPEDGLYGVALQLAALQAQLDPALSPSH